MKKIITYRNHAGSPVRVMKAMLAAALLMSIATVYSCRKTDDISPSAAQTGQQGTSAATNLIFATGQLKTSGITTYQYGQYALIVPGQAGYALRSATINFTKFVNKNVQVEGSAIRGYPVEAGPVYLDVVWIKEVENTGVQNLNNK